MLKGDGSEGYAGPFNLHTKAHLIFLKDAFQSEGTYNYHLHPTLRVQRDPNRRSALSFKDKLSGYRWANRTEQVTVTCTIEVRDKKTGDKCLMPNERNLHRNLGP